MSINLKSDNSTDEIRIDANKAAFIRPRDANGNDLAPILGSKIQPTQGVQLIGGLNDLLVQGIRVDRLGNQMSGQALPQIMELFEGATINTQKWNVANTSFAPAQTGSGLSLNPTNLTTANAVSNYRSFKQYFKSPRVPLQTKKRLRASLVNNSIFEMGFGDPSGTTAIIPNSAHWRIAGTSAVPVLTSNNDEVTGDVVDLAPYVLNYLIYDVIVDADGAFYTIHDTQNDTIVASQRLQVKLTWAAMWTVTRLPEFWRLYNTAIAPATAPLVIITESATLSHDLALPRPWYDTLAMNSLGGQTSPTAFTQLQNYANSVAPVSAALSNTAAGYATLGGQFQFVAVGGAETDYNLFSLTAPVGYQFVCKGIRIEAFNTVVAVATTPTVMQWGIGSNGATVNLSSGGAIRRALGVQTFPVGAAVGAAGAVIDKTFAVPQVTESGRVFSVILKMPIGTATATEIFRGTVDIDGYFE